MTTLGAAMNGKASAWQGCGAACWLGLAASPTFALMAWISVSDGLQDMMCAAPSGLLPIRGMASMYLLMCLFHVSPWLRLAPRHPRQLTHPATQAEGN